MNPSLALIPSAYSAGKLYSVLPEDGTGDFDVSRNGTATYLGSDGLLKTAQANEPRLEFNPDGSFKGVLVEPAATNLLLYSEKFNLSPWVTVGLLLVENQLISPDGTNSSTKVTIGIDSSSTRHRIYLSNRTITSGLTYTGSYFLKKGNHRWVQLVYVNGSAFSINSWANFDLETGTIGTVASDAIAKIEDFGNGWYRCSVTTTAIGSATTTALEILTTNNTNSGRYPSYQSTVEEDVCYVWGAQLETGSVATSYIPTEGSIVTRPADVITRTNAQDLIGQTEGTMFCYLRRKVITDNVVRQIFSISSGVITNRSEIYAFNNMIFVDRVSPTQSALNSQGIIISSELIKIAFTYKSGNSSVFINGVKVMTYTATFIFNTLNRIAIGNSSGGVTIGNNNTISAALFKTALTDEQAIALTTL